MTDAYGELLIFFVSFFTIRSTTSQLILHTIFLSNAGLVI